MIEEVHKYDNSSLVESLMIDADFQRAAERGGYGEERYEKLEFQRRVSDCYHRLQDATWKVDCFILCILINLGGILLKFHGIFDRFCCESSVGSIFG